MKRTIIYVGFMLLMLSSCINELADKINNIEVSNWNPTLEIPLAEGDFSMGDLAEELSKNNLEVLTDNDGNQIFVYHQPSVFSQQASELFSVPNQNFNAVINAGYDVPAGGVSYTIENSESYKFELNSPEGDKIREIQLKGGTLDINLSGNIPATGELTIEFSSVLKGGVPIIVHYAWSSTSTQNHSEQIDLTDASIDLTAGNTAVNSFNFSTDLTINYNGNAISSTDGFNIDINLLDLNFELLTATFGNRNITTDSKYFKLNFIDEIQNGVYYLKEPAMHFTVINSIGAPVSIDLNHIMAHSINRGMLPLSGSILNAPIDIAYPLIPGNKEIKDITLDETNSNLPDILLFQPDSIEYSFEGIVNPLNNDDVHFVTDTSSITADVLLEIPLYGYIQDIVIREPYDFDGSFFEDIDNAILRISAENGLPLDAKIQAFFFDASNTILDSLIYDDTNIFPAAKTDVDGNVTEPSKSHIDIPLNSNRLEKLSGAEKLILRAILNTPDSPTKSVRFKEKDILKVNIFGQSAFNIEL